MTVISIFPTEAAHWNLFGIFNKHYSSSNSCLFSFFFKASGSLMPASSQTISKYARLITSETLLSARAFSSSLIRFLYFLIWSFSSGISILTLLGSISWQPYFFNQPGIVAEPVIPYLSWASCTQLSLPLSSSWMGNMPDDS